MCIAYVPLFVSSFRTCCAGCSDKVSNQLGDLPPSPQPSRLMWRHPSSGWAGASSPDVIWYLALGWAKEYSRGSGWSASFIFRNPAQWSTLNLCTAEGDLAAFQCTPPTAVYKGRFPMCAAHVRRHSCAPLAPRLQRSRLKRS